MSARRSAAPWLWIVLVATLAGDGFTPPLATAATPPPAPPVRVLTSFLPVFALASAVAGDRATVENWLPPGSDPHDFQFSPRDLRRLRDARLLVVAGLGLEGWRESVLREASGNARLRLLEVATNLPPESLVHDGSHDDHHSTGSAAHDPTHASGGPNPHFWHDPILAAHAATNICRALVEIDPAGRDVYERQLQALVARLHDLDRAFARELAAVREVGFVTYHNAFPYLARRYGLKLIGVVAVNPSNEPSARELTELSARIREERARVLFVDGQAPRLAKRLASDLGLRLATLETLEVGDLRASAYEDGMRRNLAVLRDALRTPSTP